MRRLLLILISGFVGLLLGVALVLFILGAPRAKPLPGVAVQTPDPGGDPPGTAVVVLDEKFFDVLLASVFRDLGSPSFPLELTLDERGRMNDSTPTLLPAAMQDQCPDIV